MSRASLRRRLSARLRHGGILWLWAALRDRLLPVRPACSSLVRTAVFDRRGLEIGGPSRIFRPRGPLPVYGLANCVDNVNFSAETTWENGLKDGEPYPYCRRKASGRQWIREATGLTGLADESYDFVISSHCLEHVASPLAALREWRRVARNGALLAVIVPDPQRSFDHRRPITTLEHLRDDFRLGTPESDLSHLPEVLQLHDLDSDPDTGGMPEFRDRSEKNGINRCMHHHVFDLGLLAAALNDAGWVTLVTEKMNPVHLLAVARKAAP